MRSFGHQLRVWLVFYRSVAFYNLVFTASAACLYVQNGTMRVLALMFWTKVLGFLLVAYVFHQFKRDDFYFYHNQGFSKTRLLLCTLVIETIGFCLLIASLRPLVSPHGAP